MVVPNRIKPNMYWCGKCCIDFRPGQKDLKTFGFKTLEVKIMDKKQKFKDLLISTQRTGVMDLIEWIEHTDFYTAPASTCYHGAHEGGLLEHSLNVMQLFNKRCAEYTLDIDRSTIIICGLLHDICKIGLYYGKPGDYRYNKDVIKQGHAKRSIDMIRKHMKLTAQEEQIIKFHMGHWMTRECSLYADSAEYTHDEYVRAIRDDNTVVLFHFCDDESNKFLEEKEREPLQTSIGGR